MERRATQGVSAKGRTLFGYAARFNAETDLGEFREAIAPGAFASSLSANDIRAIYEHDGKALLGRSGSGTLRLSEDAEGLAFELDLPDTTLGRDLAVLVERGDLSGCSFGFLCRKDEWRAGVRHLQDIDLQEITITATPAYSATNVQVRSVEPVTVRLARLYLECI